MTLRVTILIGGIALVAGCAEPPPPRSVQEFVDNPIVLEAALVRCSRNRSETRYDAECVNAREANKIVAAREEAARRAEFEAQSERKRQALRRAQEAAAEARRRVPGDLLRRHGNTKANLALPEVPVEASHAHVDRPYARILEHTALFELDRERSKSHAFGDLHDDILVMAFRAVRVGIDDQQPAESAK